MAGPTTKKREKFLKDRGFTEAFGMKKVPADRNLFEALRRRLSKSGMSAADKKKLKELQQAQIKRDAAKTAGEKSAKAKIRAAEKAAKLKKDTKAASAKRAMTAKVTGAEKAEGKRKATEEAKQMMRAKRMDKKPAPKKKTTVKDVAPKGKAPRSVSAAQKAGKLYFMDKNNKPKLAITAEQLTKFMKAKGIKSRKEALTKFANTYKPGTGMAKFKADMKKMAMGGAMMKKKGMAMGGSMMKKKGMAMGGMKKKGMARGGMKKKGYAMGGLKATNPSQVGLRKLPESVRNKMGYMKKGGMTKKGYAKGGSMKKKGYAMGGVTKKYGIVDNRKKKR